MANWCRRCGKFHPGICPATIILLLLAGVVAGLVLAVLATLSKGGN